MVFSNEMTSIKPTEADKYNEGTHHYYTSYTTGYVWTTGSAE